MKAAVVAAFALAAACAGCGSTPRHPQLIAEPHSSLVDAPVHVRLSGVDPGTRVTIAAQAGAWLSRATFVAGRDGDVDLARDSPRSGSYTGRDEMGLFWSMSTPGGTGVGWPGEGGEIDLVARAGGKEIASTSVDRRLSTSGVRMREATLERDGFVGRYYRPERSDGVPVLVFGGSEGGLLEAEPALLASHGHPTLALAYFAEPGLPQSLVEIPLEYFVRAIRWLDRQPGVDASRLVVSGVSRGSEAALLLGAHFPQLVHAVVALAPSSLVNRGLSPDPIHAVAAWTLHGRPIPFPSEIPVERIGGPIFLAAGTADALWPSADYERHIVTRLHAHGRRAVTALSYPHAGHDVGFAVPNVPLATTVSSRYGQLDLGGSRKADAHARADLWPKLLRFLAAVPGGSP